MNNNSFWYEALKAGTIVGLVSAALSLMKMYATCNDMVLWVNLLSFLTIIIFVIMVYAFTRRRSLFANGETGFSYNDGMKYVLAMMIFTGIIMGVYSTLANNFLFNEHVQETIDSAMVTMQDMIDDEMFDEMYDTTSRMMYNPISQVFGNVIMYLISGGFVGLIICIFTKRNPDWTDSNDNTTNADEK